jgi:hypothetical protein
MLDIYQFDLKPLKRNFTIFIIVVTTLSTLFCLATFLLPIVPGFVEIYQKYFWFYFIAFLIFNFALEGINKKGYSQLAQTDDFQQKVIIYAGIYNRKLILNGVSFIITAVFLFLSHKLLFLIILSGQGIFLPIFYPRPAKIAKALNNGEILFI